MTLAKRTVVAGADIYVHAIHLSSGPQAQGLEQLRELAAKGPLTLLTASKAVDISEAAVLAQLLNA